MALLPIVGCNGDDDGASGTTTSSTDVDQTSTTEPETTTTVSREDSLRRRVVELLGIRDQLLMNPNPNRLGEWVLPACPCFEVELGIQQEYVNNGYHADGPDAEMLGVELTDRQDPRFPIFTVVWRLRELHVVDAVGNVVRARTGTEPRGISVTLHQVEGQWLVQDLFELALDPNRIAEVIAVGVP